MQTRKADDAYSVFRDVSALLDNPAATLAITSSDLLAHVEAARITAYLKTFLGPKPSLLGQVFKEAISYGSSVPDMLSRQVDFHGQRWKHDSARRHIESAMRSFLVQRAVIAMSDQEKELMRAMAALHAERGISQQDWSRFVALMTWAEGTATVSPPASIAAHKHAPLAREALMRFSKDAFPSHNRFLEESANVLAAHSASGTTAARSLAAFLFKGSRWLQPADLATSAVYRSARTSAALLIGYAENDRPVYFDGNESLFTIAPPGTGKTQGQVIPNLLEYPGSVFVLDVKGELWAATAERRRAFGDVYRFAPTDAAGMSHRYNPLDFISGEPQQAALDCQVLAEQLVTEKTNLKDPYWEGRARDLIWAFAMLVALTPGMQRDLAKLSDLFSFRSNFEDREDEFHGSETDELIRALKQLGESTGIPDLKNAAASIESGLGSGQRLESVLDTARRFLATFARSQTLRTAMSASDWHPLQLRSRPGTSVYLCLKPGDLRAFAPIVRVIFQQHVNLLTRQFTARPDEPPITFFLDEMPQLGYLASLSDMIDVGRGAGLRLWMFAQFLGQVREAYGQRADGLINACRIRCFMQPDNDAASFISPALGRTRNFFTGKEQNLAEPHDLMGRPYSDKVITLARGDYPALLDRKMHYLSAR